VGVSGGNGGSSVARLPNGLIEGKDYFASDMDVDAKFALARSVGEECIQDAELRLLLEKKPHPIVYDGFEPSGRMHIAQGVMRAINVNKLTKCGCVFKVRPPVRWHNLGVSLSTHHFIPRPLPIDETGDRGSSGWRTGSRCSTTRWAGT